MERFLLYSGYSSIVERFTDEQAGRLFKGIFMFIEDGNVPKIDDPAVNTALWFICDRVAKDSEKYRVCGGGKWNK